MSDCDSILYKQSKEMLMNFKQFGDALMGEKMALSYYVEFVVFRGVEGILRDIIPKEQDVPGNTIWPIMANSRSEANPEVFCDMVCKFLKIDEKANRNAARQKLAERIKLIQGSITRARKPELHARSMTKHFFEAYLKKIEEGKSRKNRYDGIKAAWNYFSAFNQPMPREAKEWFEKSIGKVDDFTTP